MKIENDTLKVGKKRIALIDYALELYLKLWSNRLMLLAALLSGGEAGIQIYLGGEPWKALFICVISFAATIARMIPQPKAVEKAAEKAEEKKESQ